VQAHTLHRCPIRAWRASWKERQGTSGVVEGRPQGGVAAWQVFGWLGQGNEENFVPQISPPYN
jgi:hypothetical protein